MSKDELQDIYGELSIVEFINATSPNCTKKLKDFLDGNILCVLNVSGSLDNRDALLETLYEKAELAAGAEFYGDVSGSYSDDSKNFEATLSLRKRKD